MRPFYYVRTIEKVHIALADMFNDLVINKYSSLSREEILRTHRVPLVIGGYDKNFGNFIRNLGKKYNMPTPVMGLRFINATPRKSNIPQLHYIRTLYSEANNELIRDAQPIPHDLTFQLDIYTESWADYGQIVENILPYFTPFRTLRIKEFSEVEDLERKVYAYIQSPNLTYQDEYQRGPTNRKIEESITITCKADLYRPHSQPDVVQYAELNIDSDNNLGAYPMKLQSFAYPTDLIESIRKPWESVEESKFPGYSILNSYSGLRPAYVPDFSELNLLFNQDTDNEVDQSVFGRNLVFLRDAPTADRIFLPGMGDDGGELLINSGYGNDYGPATSTFFTLEDVNITENTFRINGQSNLEIGSPITFVNGPNGLPAGVNDSTLYYIKTNKGNDTYILSENSDLSTTVNITSIGDGTVITVSRWNKLLTWFGSNDGLMDKPYSFRIKLQFVDEDMRDTTFMHLFNSEIGTQGEDGYIPENSMWFAWGVTNENKLHFTISTYGGTPLNFSFQTVDSLELNNIDIYTFQFMLYNEGYDGLHILKINDETEMPLETERIEQ